MSTYVFDARTATPHFPGIGRYVASLAQALEPLLESHESLTVLHHPDHPISLAGRAQPREVGISPFSLGQQRQLPALLRAAGATVYHSGYYLMPYRAGVPSIVTLHDLIPLLFPKLSSLRARAGFRVAVSLALRASRICITDSESTRRDVLAAFRVAPAKVRAIPLAAAPDFKPQSSAELAALRARYALPDRFYLYLGSNKPHKNLVRLISAYAPLASADCPLVIAGAWDSRYPEAKQAAATLAPDTVRWLGAIPEPHLPALYGAALAFVFPSLYEGFGLPVVEAMACGTPVACSRSSSLPEVAGEACLLFDPTDVQALTQVLQQLREDAGLRRALHERGLIQARGFSWRRSAEATLQLYREVAQTVS